MQKVYIASPYSATEERTADETEGYLMMALEDSLARGEAPYASHAVYPAFLDDDVPADRLRGMEAGLAWLSAADVVAVYADLGVSVGMRVEIEAARKAGVSVIWRYLIEEQSWSNAEA